VGETDKWINLPHNTPDGRRPEREDLKKNMYKEENKVEQMRVAVDLSVWERKGRGDAVE
jgi:hypothetical protein